MKHIVLRMLVLMINSNLEKVKEGVAVTLAVNGLIISGRIIPRDVFYDIEQNLVLKTFRDSERKNFTDEQRSKEKNDLTYLKNIDILHLTEAVYLTGTQKIPSITTTSIIVDIDSIDAYNMGSMNYLDR
ncbi:hypothetical protein MMP66_00485 [Acinetobacter dispersus]|uniref:Uncharacterized protein n=1 Tax=Acinetobacter dispersus TaxID=70348 RepID=N9MQH0_9GAMM|nr:hypothetical protein [Acinetobacter dispersus]ENW92991.1 hypothetical protein F904_02934 [Acinetobacter dispersus]ENX54740.1 hypothetical protein F901_02055 [Acinetobacter dispersus]MCH7389067.1 hypothetical protein [Acinetobacter dispersus]MCH7392752.1 hypothetical protein [Acinetobacter dispersus]